jgi:hypothetical protein
MVAIFCGRVLPLDRDIMRQGSLDEKKEHLLEVLGVFLHERIERLLTEQPAKKMLEGDDDGATADEEAAPAMHKGDEPKSRPYGKTPEQISQDEMDAFLRIDLQMIDNPEYFKAVFS